LIFKARDEARRGLEQGVARLSSGKTPDVVPLVVDDDPLRAVVDRDRGTNNRDRIGFIP